MYPTQMHVWSIISDWHQYSGRDDNNGWSRDLSSNHSISFINVRNQQSLTWLNIEPWYHVLVNIVSRVCVCGNTEICLCYTCILLLCTIYSNICVDVSNHKLCTQREKHVIEFHWTQLTNHWLRVLIELKLFCIKYVLLFLS